MKNIINDMDLDYPLYTENDYKKEKPDAYEHGIYKYIPNQYWGLWTQLKPFWCFHKTNNPDGIGIYEALEDIWDIIEEELVMGEITYSINREVVKGNRRNGHLFCKYTPEYLQKSLTKDNGLHEIIYRKPTKLFVDIDVKCENDLPNKVLHEQYKETILEVKRVFAELINYKKKKHIEPEFIISEAIGVDGEDHYKYSCHLICKGYYITSKMRILLGNYLTKKLPEIVNMYVDKCVYEEKRKLKLPNQLKLDDKLRGLNHRAQKIQEGTNLMDYVLQNITGCKCLDKSLEAMSKKLKIKGKKLIREMRVKPVCDRPTPSVDSLTRLSPLQILTLFDRRPKHMCKQFHRRIILWCCANGISFNEWYEYFSDWWRNPYHDHNRKPEREGGRKRGYNEDYTYRKIWREQWDTLQNKNIPIKMEWIKKALRAQYPDFYERDEQKFNQDIIDADNIDGFMYSEKEYYTIFKPTKEKPHLPVEMIKKIRKKYVLLSTGLGQGKTWDTQILTKEIIRRNCFGKVLYICNRIALKEDILGKFIDTEKFDLGDETYDYKDIKSGKKELPYSSSYVLLTTLESLPQFHHTGYDLVVVDECEAVNMTFLTDSMKSTLPGNRYEQVVNAYGDLLTTAKKVIMCDGLLMKRTMNFIDDIEGISGSKYFHLYHTIVSNEKNLQERSIIYYRDDPKCSAHYRFMNDLLDHLVKEDDDGNIIHSGKKVYLFMPHLTGKSSPLKISRDKGNDVEGQGVLLLKKYFMEYCNLSEDDIKLHYGNATNNKNLQNVNVYWSEGKLVLSTSCITNGVSYDNKTEVYDSVWLLTDSSFISARDTAQISARMRYLNDYKIRVCDLTNGASPTMFNRPNYVSKPLFKDSIENSTTYKKIYITADFKKWLKRGKKNKPKSILRSIKYAIMEKNIVKRLIKWDERKKQRYEIAIKNLHKEITREHYVRGSSVLIRMFKKLGIEVFRTIEPHKGDEARAKKKFNNIGIGISRINAEWEYDNIEVLEDNVLYEQYRFQNKRGLLGNTERYELQKRNFLNQFKDDTPEDVLRDMFDSKIYKGFKALVNGTSILQKVFDIREGLEWKGVLSKDDIKMKSALKPNKSSLLRRCLDFGGITNHKKMIRKVINNYFSKRYIEAEMMDNGDPQYNEKTGKLEIVMERTGNDILGEEFYNDLNTFIKWFDFENPLTFDGRDYPLYLPFTARVLYKGGGSDIIHPDAVGGIDEDRAEKLQINYWLDDEIKVVLYDKNIVDEVCAMNPYIIWKNTIKDMEKKRDTLKGNDYYNMDMEIDNMKMREYEYKYKWKMDAGMIWSRIESILKKEKLVK